MFILSAFADEIDPDPRKQIDVLKKCGINHLELRSIEDTNILDLTPQQCNDLKRLLQDNGVRLSALGSPIGKVAINGDWANHLDKFKHALELCHHFETGNMRIFSYYPPGPDIGWEDWREEVFQRMRQKVELARMTGIRLLHENEHRIFAESPDHVVELMTICQESANAPTLAAVYDPANYVFRGYDPWDAWQKTKDWTAHFHIKDWIGQAAVGSLPGQGQGRIPEVMADAQNRGYHGFATLEPHLASGGQMGGKTGPVLFEKAVTAFKAILDNIGARYS